VPVGLAYVVKCLNCLYLMFYAEDDVVGAPPRFPEMCPSCGLYGRLVRLGRMGGDRVKFRIVSGTEEAVD
jgi:hypothetical protein